MTVPKLCPPSLLVQQHLKRVDEFEVRSRRDVVVSVEFQEVAL